jgi:hypothetical protein
MNDVSNLPPVSVQKSRQIFISAASATTDIRILSSTHCLRVSCIFPGSHVVREPNIMTISLDECDGKWLNRSKVIRRRNKWFQTHLIPPRAISNAFCKLGSPEGSKSRLLATVFNTSGGFPETYQRLELRFIDHIPDNPHIRSATPSFIPTIPICPRGF